MTAETFFIRASLALLPVVIIGSLVLYTETQRLNPISTTRQIDWTNETGIHKEVIEDNITEHVQGPIVQCNGGAEQSRRQFRLRKECSKNNLSNEKMTCGSFVVVKPLKLLITVIPKTGGTNWGRLILSILGYHNMTQDIPARASNVEFHKRFRYLRTVKESERKNDLENFRRVIFVRNPFVRLLSAFRDRLEAYPNRYLGHRRWHNKKIFTQFEKHSKAEMPGPSVPSELYNVTFKGFVDYYLAGHTDVHWQNQYKICHPCFGYDFIGKQETYTSDVIQVLKMIEADSKFYPLEPLNPTHSGGDETLKKYYSTLSNSQFLAVKKKMQNDMTYFGYCVPDSIDRPHLKLI